MSIAAHRVLWAVIGLFLTALGAAGILATYRAMPGVDSDSPLLWSGLLGWWAGISPWGPILAAVVGALLAVLGFRLLARQLRVHSDPAMGELTVRDDGTGRTAVRAGVLASGLERDLALDHRIRRASVTLTGAPPEPEVWIRLHLAADAPIAAVQDHVRAAVDRFARTSGLRPRHLDVTAAVDTARPARVR